MPDILPEHPFFRGSQEVADLQDDECIYLSRCSLSEIDPFTNAVMLPDYTYDFGTNKQVPKWYLPDTTIFYWTLRNWDIPARLSYPYTEE